MNASNKPRPYSTLRDGKIVWVTPDEHAASQGGKRRSRLETDDEVRARLKPAMDKAAQVHPWFMWSQPPNPNGKSGIELDKLLKEYKLEPRRYVDDIQ